MAESVGLHWASKGWIGVSRIDDEWAWDLFPSIWSAWQTHSEANQIVVTTPMGLPSPSGSRRECDEAAKRLLGPRHSSVYYAPVRAAVYETSLTTAKELNDPAGFGIQNQAWSHIPRIRELDEFLLAVPAAQSVFHETQPDLCFHALAERALQHSRRTEAGIDERLAIIDATAPSVTDPIREAISAFTQPRYAPLVTSVADVLDGFIAAVTADRHPDVATLPISPPQDEHGIPMAIVYPGDNRQLTLHDLE